MHPCKYWLWWETVACALFYDVQTGEQLWLPSQLLPMEEADLSRYFEGPPSTQGYNIKLCPDTNLGR